MTAMRGVGVAVALVAALGLAGCMEVEQTATAQKSGKYQGKPDTQPWNNEPLAYGSNMPRWSRGDRTSWETQIKNRNLVQHEDKRIYQ